MVKPIKLRATERSRKLVTQQYFGSVLIVGPAQLPVGSIGPWNRFDLNHAAAMFVDDPIQFSG
jgi:hypothetical protein